MAKLIRQRIDSWLLAAVTSFALVACGGDYGGGGNYDGGTPGYTGMLTLTITGLPAGTNAAVALTGPVGYSQQVMASTVLDNLRPGDYTITASNVAVGNTSYVPTPASQTVTVSTGSDGYGMGSNATASVSYAVGAGKVEGAISKLDPLTIGERQYDISAATVVLNDQVAQASDLRAGMIVTMQIQRRNDGSLQADDIRYRADFSGPVTRIDLDRQSLEVLGQQIRVDAGTVFDDRVGNAAALAQLYVGNVVEISGYAAADGSLLARRIERKFNAADRRSIYIAHGAVDALDTDKQQFRLAGLPVSYATKANFANGERVQVRGRLGQDGLLQAARVTSLGNDALPDQGKSAELHGLVRAIGDSGFLLNGHRVQAPISNLINAGKLRQLPLHKEVVVLGFVTEDGSVRAENIRFD